MKIKKIEIHNYKTINRISVDFFKDITLLVGKNNIGKSNVLKAVEIFFKWIEKRDLLENLDSKDFRKNSTQIVLSATFDEVDKLVSNLKKYLIEESSKSRPNQETIKYYEMLFRSFQLIENKFHEFCLKLTIPRSFDNSPSLEIVKSTSKSQIKKFNEIITKRYYAEKHFPDVLKEKQQLSKKDWFDYKWLKIEIKSDGQKFVSYKDKEVNIKDDKVNDISDGAIDKLILEYIKSTQKFFYVPAYRGGKSERDEAINKLFDIIIEDLVIPKKGKSKDYDTITDAIWGKGKNSNIYNLQSVIGARLKALTDDLKDDAISSIKEIEFQPFTNDEVRRRILKIMLGNSSIFLNDGVKTSFESKGTGIQSSFMITLMKALSKIEFEKNINIILVIEEPEAFAHPQLIREIIDKISQEFSKDLFQFIVSTHSPVIVNFVNSNRVQRLHLNSAKNETLNITNKNNLELCEEDWNLINRIGDVNLSEIVFSDLVIFVEGEGDKIVFEKLLKIVMPDFYSKISIISISGNNQLFKLLKLLKYYDINWMMLFDKDSFVNKGEKDLDLISENDLVDFFTKYQIGAEFQNNFKNVINNQIVSKIRIAVQSAPKIGEILSKINEVYSSNDVNIIRQELYAIILKKLNDAVFPEEDAKDITREFNNRLLELQVPFYSLISDLEGFVINSNTKGTTEEVYLKYYEQSFKDFKNNYKNASEQDYLKALRKVFGSKTHTLERAPREKKKPHIPIEIVTNYLQKIFNENNIEYKNTVLNAFSGLDDLVKTIEKKLE
ncbi:MAG: AAA family ATPase [Lutibacter sp.]